MRARPLFPVAPDGTTRRAAARTGFTIVELLVVIVVIAALTAIAIPTYLNQRQKGYDASTKSDILNIYSSMKAQWTGDESYEIGQVAAVRAAEGGFQVAAAPTGGNPAYVMRQTQVSVPNENTVIVTQRSRSGRDFCLVARERGADVGILPSWKAPSAATVTNLGCPSSSTLAIAGPSTPTTPVTPTTGPPTTSYAIIRAQAPSNATCPFNEVAGAIGNNQGSNSCPGLNSGQYHSAFTLGEPGALKTWNGTAWVQDTANLAIRYSGVQHFAYFGSSNAISNHGTYSTEVWVKPATANQTSVAVSADDAWSMELTGTGFRCGHQSNNPWGPVYASSNAVAPAANQWYHLVCTVEDGSPAAGQMTVRLYVNGLLRQSNAYPSGRNSTTGPSFRPGFKNNASYLNGWLDEFSYYASLMGDARVKALYEAGCGCLAE